MLVFPARVCENEKETEIDEDLEYLLSVITRQCVSTLFCILCFLVESRFHHLMLLLLSVYSFSYPFYFSNTNLFAINEFVEIQVRYIKNLGLVKFIFIFISYDIATR